MTVDERVGSALNDLAAAVAPLPDPAGRAYQRLRRSRRRRRTTIGLVAVLVAALPFVARPSEPQVGDGWTRRMTEAPRGPLAGDTAFITEVERRVLARGTFGDADNGYRAARVVLAGDFAQRRIVLLALEIAHPEAGRRPDDHVWLMGPPGASPATLVSRETSKLGYEGLEPFVWQYLVGLTVAVAPAGCEIQTAALPALDDWVPAPEGSYLVRPEPSPAEWWRVTCDGQVRLERPSPAPRTYDGSHSGPASAADYEEAALTYGSEVYDAPGVLWAAPVRVAMEPDLPSPVEAPGILMASPLVGGGWKAKLQVHYSKPTGEGYGSYVEFTVAADPFSAQRFYPVRLFENQTSIVAVAPPDAVRVRAFVDGSVIADQPVRQGAAVLRVPLDDRDTVRYEALDASGAVITAEKEVEPGVVGGRPWLENWS